MELSDRLLTVNRDWDPSYLRSLFDTDFYEFNQLWTCEIEDSDLVKAANDVEMYSPIVEDISMDDSELCTAVEKIEEGYVFNLVCS